MERRQSFLFWISVATNLLTAGLAVAGFAIIFPSQGIGMLWYYTILSNLLGAVAALLVVMYRLIGRRKHLGRLPYWVVLLKYLATVCLTLTFLVVVFFLAPQFGEGGYRLMLFSPEMFFHHLACPLLALGSMIALDTDARLPKKSLLFALIPTAMYALVLILLNIFRVKEGPYFFLMVHRQPVWMSFLWIIIIFFMVFLIAFVVRFFSNLDKSYKIIR